MSDTPDPTVWPPPSLRPPVDVWEVERVHLVRTEGRLTLTNLAAKRGLQINVVLSLLIVILVPVITTLLIFVGVGLAIGFKAELGERARHLLVHAAWLLIKCLFYFAVFVASLLVAYSWFFYACYLHRGRFALHRAHNVFQRNGKEYCSLSELTRVMVKPSGRRWLVQLVRGGGDPRPRWRQLLTYPTRPDVTQIAALRKRTDAEAVADAIADFAGVPVTGPPK